MWQPLVDHELSNKNKLHYSIQKKKRQTTLKRLTLEYARADKAKTSFGYIGITFLILLFGSIFLNDLIKVCIYYCDGLRVYRKKKKVKKEVERKQDQATCDEVRLDIMDRYYADVLDEDLERVYFQLVKANTRNRRASQT